MKTYKGTDKDMRCYGGYQYELGVLNKDDGAVRCGDKGFHSCEAPMDVLRYFPAKKRPRYFEAEAGGVIDRTDATDTKIASSELTLKREIDFPELVKVQIEYTRKNAARGTAGGDRSNLAGGDGSHLAGGHWSNLAGGYGSNLAGGKRSNLACGHWSNLAGGNGSNLAGGDDSNLAGGDDSNLAGGHWSNLAGGDDSNLAGGKRSNLAGGDRSNLAGGDGSHLAGGDDSNISGGSGSNLVGGYWSTLIGGIGSTIICPNGAKAKAGADSLIVFTRRAESSYRITHYTVGIVDGQQLKPDTWYQMVDGEIREVPDHAD